MVDYSKWDKFSNSLSDESDEEQQPMKVTKFDKKNGETITIGPQGYRVEGSKNISSDSMPAIATAVEKKILVDAFSENGAVLEKYKWMQNRYEVRLTIPLPDTVKPKNVSVDVVDKVLTVSGGEAVPVLLSGTLRYMIKMESTEEAQATLRDRYFSAIDWVIEQESARSPLKVVRITLYKQSPIPGAFIWWENVFEGEDKIDTTKIAGRNSVGAKSVSDNFVEAQKLFAEKIAKNEKIDVEFDDHS
jgi:hypothetical protein